MNSIRTGVREGIMAARSPGMLLGAASFALLWGLGWWLAAPAVDAGFANGAPADTAGVIQLWTLTAAVLVPMLVMRTVLEPDRTGLIEWRLSGPVRPIGLVVSMLLTTSIALSLFVLPILPIIGVSLLHDASVVTMLGQAVVSVLLLLTWAAVVISTTVWLRSTFLTLLFTLMVPALALGAVAALPLLADRVDDAGLGWLSSALSRLARQLASNHPLRLSQGLLDGQLEWSSLLNVGFLAALSLFAASEGLRLRAFAGKVGLRRHAAVRIFGVTVLAMVVFSGSNRNISGSLDLTPRSRALPSPRLIESMSSLPEGSTIFLTLNGDQVPPDDFRFARRILQRAAMKSSIETVCVDLSALRRGEISSQQIADWQNRFSAATFSPNQIRGAIAYLEDQSGFLDPSEHADVIVGVRESLRRVQAGLQRGVLPDLGSIARQLSVALQQLSDAQAESTASDESMRMARALMLLADEDQFVAAKLFSGNGGMALIREGEIQAFRPAASFLVQFKAQTPLRSESAFSQAMEAFVGVKPPLVSIMAPSGAQDLVQSVGYELQLRGLRVLPFEDNNPDCVLLVLADPPPAVESDPTGFAFVREVANAIEDPTQDVVLCVGPSVRARYGLDSPWEELLSGIGLDVALKSALGESVTRRSKRQTDLLVRPDWRSADPVSASIGGLPIAFPLAVDLGSEGSCFQWLPSSRRGRVSNWTSPEAQVEETFDAMGLVRLIDDGGRRLAVVGSARWLSPSLKSNPTSFNASSGNHELASSLLRWASGQDALGKGPNAALGRFQPSAFERLIWMIIVVGLIPLGLALAGCCSAWRRSS
ncbi:MAG: hypothetical protein CBB84_005065 [Phycisphaera sp. TMED24]|nr:MAG: hypothetical protein CBB84_005065 [Phycisphaera sp. TMED24]